MRIGLRVDEDRAEHALLGFDRLRGELVDAHRGGPRRRVARFPRSRLRPAGPRWRILSNRAHRIVVRPLNRLIPNAVHIAPAGVDGMWKVLAGDLPDSLRTGYATGHAVVGGERAPVRVARGAAASWFQASHCSTTSPSASKRRTEVPASVASAPSSRREAHHVDRGAIAVDDRVAHPDARIVLLGEHARHVVADAVAAAVRLTERLGRERAAFGGVAGATIGSGSSASQPSFHALRPATAPHGRRHRSDRVASTSVGSATTLTATTASTPGMTRTSIL